MCTVELLEFIERFHCIYTGIIIIVHAHGVFIYRLALFPGHFLQRRESYFCGGTFFPSPAKNGLGTRLFIGILFMCKYWPNGEVRSTVDCVQRTYKYCL